MEVSPLGQASVALGLYLEHAPNPQAGLGSVPSGLEAPQWL